MPGQDTAASGLYSYIKLVVCFLLSIGLAAGIYEGVTAVRDACFPGKSMLAQSIRSQLPYSSETPDWEELFAMDDQDIAENQGLCSCTGSAAGIQKDFIRKMGPQINIFY